MNEKYAALRANVGMLGQLLGKSIKDHQGQAFLDKIETIRQLAKSSRKGNETDRERLLETLRTLSDDELLPVARAFSQFLNLANVAEQFHTISRRCEEQECTPDPLEQMFAKLKASNLSQEAIIQAVRELDIDLVLTAHPTEVTRRTLIHKHVQLNDCLEALELSDLLPRERDKILNRIEQLVNQAWHTNEIREQRPTPVDEAKWGFAVVENSLWPAIPEFMRNLDERLQHHLGVRLPLDAAPVKFTSWMGGDRDGNPFVTAKVTAEVLELGRWMAVNLFYKDIKELTSELSMADCTEALRARVGDNPEPYRALVRELREALRETQEFLTAKVQGQASESRDLIKTTAQLREPLELCYHSLHACGMGNIADGMLLDVLRKLACFGIHLVKLDIRQDGERHGQVFSELTRYLGVGDYAEWSEEDKQAFLLTELNSRRPLLPPDWQPSEETQEVLDTCRVIAETDPGAFGIYIISMARQASDVLAVQLLREHPVELGLLLLPGTFLAFLSTAWGRRGMPVAAAVMFAMLLAMAPKPAADLHEALLRSHFTGRDLNDELRDVHGVLIKQMVDGTVHRRLHFGSQPQPFEVLRHPAATRRLEIQRQQGNRLSY